MISSQGCHGLLINLVRWCGTTITLEALTDSVQSATFNLKEKFPQELDGKISCHRGGATRMKTGWWIPLATHAVLMRILLGELPALAGQFPQGSSPSGRWKDILHTFSQRGRVLAMDKKGCEKCGTWEGRVGWLYHEYYKGHIYIYIPCLYHAITMYGMQEHKLYSNIWQYVTICDNMHGYLSISSMDVKYRTQQNNGRESVGWPWSMAKSGESFLFGWWPGIGIQRV